MGMMTWSWYLVVVGVPLIMACRSVWMCISRPAGYRAEPACENCRYTVVGLVEFTCPECGTDLRRTGIITPAMEMRRRGSLLGGIVGFSAVIFLAFIVLSSIFATLSLNAARTSATMSSVTSSALKPKSGSFVSACINAEPDPAGGPYGTRMLEIVGPKTVRVLIVNKGGPSEATSAYDEAGGPIPDIRTHDNAGITALLRAAGVDPTGPDFEIEARSLSHILDDPGISWDFPSTHTGFTVSDLQINAGTLGPRGRAGFAAVGTVGVAGKPGLAAMRPSPASTVVSPLVLPAMTLSAWVIGIVLIVVRRRRLMRDAVQGKLSANAIVHS